jgi:hypothetical protein
VNLVLAAALLLHPVLAEDGDLRIVAVGTGAEEVTWTMDGNVVATTRDGEAVSVPAGAGPHELWATSPADGAWRALARPDGAVPGGAGAVPAWTAVYVPQEDKELPTWTWPAAGAAAAVASLVRPRSVLQAWGRRRRS